MFWGLKINSGNQYNSLVEKSFHVSHAVLEPNSKNDDRTAEVHIVLHKVDYIVCLLSEKCPQQSLNLEISEGEEMTVFVKTTGCGEEACVHLTGFLVIEEEHPWEEGEGESEIWDGEEESEIWDGEEDTNEKLTDIIFNGRCTSDDEGDEDYMIDYPSLSHLEQSSSLISSEEEDEDEVRARKRKADDKKVQKLKKKRKVLPNEEQIVESEEVLPLEVDKKKERKTLKKKSISSVKNDTQKVTSSIQEVKSKDTSGVKQENCKKTLRCGVDVEELKYGTGKIAKRGSMVKIRYSGHSTGENPIHDTLERDEKPLSFTIGKKEVMLGLEQGVRGMKIGGQRRIVIPPSLRQEGDVPPEIPQDADIVLDVQLLSIA